MRNFCLLIFRKNVSHFINQNSRLLQKITVKLSPNYSGFHQKMSSLRRSKKGGRTVLNHRILKSSRLTAARDLGFDLEPVEIFFLQMELL